MEPRARTWRCRVDLDRMDGREEGTGARRLRAGDNGDVRSISVEGSRLEYGRRMAAGEAEALEVLAAVSTGDTLASLGS